MTFRERQDRETVRWAAVRRGVETGEIQKGRVVLRLIAFAILIGIAVALVAALVS